MCYFYINFAIPIHNLSFFWDPQHLIHLNYFYLKRLHLHLLFHLSLIHFLFMDKYSISDCFKYFAIISAVNIINLSQFSFLDKFCIS